MGLEQNINFLTATGILDLFLSKGEVNVTAIKTKSTRINIKSNHLPLIIKLDYKKTVRLTFRSSTHLSKKNFCWYDKKLINEKYDWVWRKNIAIPMRTQHGKLSTLG